jgi:hypothetical protein
MEGFGGLNARTDANFARTLPKRFVRRNGENAHFQ